PLEAPIRPWEPTRRAGPGGPRMDRRDERGGALGHGEGVGTGGVRHSGPACKAQLRVNCQVTRPSPPLPVMSSDALVADLRENSTTRPAPSTCRKTPGAARSS